MPFCNCSTTARERRRWRAPAAVWWRRDTTSALSCAPSTRSTSGLSQSEALKGTLKQSGTGLLLEKLHFFLALAAATFTVVSLPSALAGVALYFFLARFTPRRGIRLAVTLAYALGTNAFPYSGSF